MSLHLSKLEECTAQRENPNVNGDFGVMMTCPCRFISCNKCTTVTMGSLPVCWDGSMWGLCTCRSLLLGT